MVGFSEEEYTATEGESIPVCVEILEAETALGRSIPFRVFTSDCDDEPGMLILWGSSKGRGRGTTL